jgi:hypothetical protein
VTPVISTNLAGLYKYRKTITFAAQKINTWEEEIREQQKENDSRHPLAIQDRTRQKNQNRRLRPHLKKKSR